jgi:HK97 family phage portal protein
VLPELSERLSKAWRGAKDTFRDATPIELGLSTKGIGDISFDTVNIPWYRQNGYERIYAALSGGLPAWSGEPVSLATSMNHSVVWACNRIISETQGSTPLNMLQRRGGVKQLAVDHPMYSAMANAPNGEMSAMSFQETRTSHCCLRGNAFAQIIRRSGTGTAIQLRALDPGQVAIAREKAGQKRLVYVVSYGVNDEKTFTVDDSKPQDILHIRGIGDDGVRGYSVINFARQSIGTALAVERNLGRFYANGGRVPYVLEMEKRFAKDQDYDQFRADWTKTITQPHLAPILEPGMTYKQTGLNFADAQMLETRLFDIHEICRWFLISPHLVGDLSRATFCLPGDAEVYTAEGPRRIDQVSVGDQVWSRGKDNWVLSAVTRSACTGYDDILTIKTTNRTLRLNAKHRVLARVKHLACAGAVAGQAIKAGQHPVRWTEDWIPAGDLRIGDTIVNLQSLPSAGIDKIPSGRAASEEFMEFCGLLIGDGNVSTVHGEPVGVQIARAAKATYMDHYRNSMRSLFQRQDGQPVWLDEQPRQTRFKSATVARELSFLGLCGTARTKRVPGWVFGMSGNFRLAFIRGFLDADGSVDKMGRASFSSCSHTLLSQIRHLCMGCGIPVTNLRCGEGQTKLPNGHMATFRQFTFTCSDPAANLRIGSRTPVYVERMKAGRPFGRKARSYQRYGGQTFDTGTGCELARINSIERSVIHEPVFDLEVEGTHSFIADGVVVHNSNIEQLALEFVKVTMQPWFTRWEQDLWRCVLTPEEKHQGFYFKHNTAELLRGDFLTRMQGYSIMLQNGLASRNELRDLEDWNAFVGGDSHTVQLNMQTIPPDGILSTPGENSPDATVPADGSQDPSLVRISE